MRQQYVAAAGHIAHRATEKELVHFYPHYRYNNVVN
jgi:hypothetical protein